MSIHDQDHGDYVLVHKSKAKISRARKAVIGIMAIGAIAAIAGGGTFASFSASTTNDGVFRTGRVELSNTVNSGDACFSTQTAPAGVNDANLDENETNCSALFAADLRPGVLSTSDVTLDNSSSYVNGNLYLFGVDDVDTGTTNACASVVNDSGFRSGLKGTGNICDKVEMTIQEYSDSARTSALVSCVFPYDDDAVCPTLNPSSATAAAKIDQFPWNYGSGAGARNLGAFNTNVSSGERYFRITVTMPNGGFSATGLGLDNKYQNLKPSMKLRWLLQDAA